MIKKNNRIVILFYSMVCVFVAIIFSLILNKTVFAEDIDNEIWKYIVNDDGISITGYVGTENDIVIPDIIDEKNVVSIGDYAFFECTELTSITIPEGITSIGESAFQGCSSLITITIPESVSTIGGSAFKNCISLESIKLPDELLSLESRAFYNCKSLKSIEIPEGIKTIYARTFSFCTSMEYMKFPSTLSQINDDDMYVTFDGLQNLLYIELAEGFNGELPTITQNKRIYYFIKCSAKTAEENNLVCTSDNNIFTEKIGEDISLIFDIDKMEMKISGAGEIDPDVRYNSEILKILDLKFRYYNAVFEVTDLTIIPDDMFGGCYGLTSVELPEGLIHIGNNAFWCCVSLNSITIPQSVKTIGFGAFQQCCFSSITIPEGIKTIEAGLFAFNRSLKSIKIPEGVNIIEEDAFEDCESLTSVTLPESLRLISKDTFSNCFSLTNIVIPDGVIIIEDYAFENCISLTSINIPKGETTIRYAIFSGCTGLKKIIIPDNILSIDDRAFEGCTNLTCIAIPDGLKSIGFHAFIDCKSLKCIKIPQGVSSIGEGAFSGCSALTSISIPALVTELKNQAFMDCFNLESIIIPPSVTIIDAGAFDNCDKVKIYGALGSFAEYFASENDIPFVVYLFETDNTTENTENKEENNDINDNIPNEPQINPDSSQKTQTDSDLPQFEDGVGTVSEDGMFITDKDGTKYSISERLIKGQLRKNMFIVDKESEGKYKITRITKKNGRITGGKVSYQKPYNTNCKAVNIKATIKIAGVTFKITSISNNAFKGCSNISKVTIGKNITQIGKKACFGCSNLKVVTIKSNSIKKIGGKAFEGINKKAKIKVPKKKLKEYKKMIKKAGAPNNAKITR
ncbi:MAG: leucine-rich repeat protein [Eubacterium sp.]|nr:leucine-rich repeat protein [Eubacterium sp.]